eukprot:6459099-Amphidinium_carterae.3
MSEWGRQRCRSQMQRVDLFCTRNGSPVQLHTRFLEPRGLGQSSLHATSPFTGHRPGWRGDFTGAAFPESRAPPYQAVRLVLLLPHLSDAHQQHMGDDRLKHGPRFNHWASRLQPESIRNLLPFE